MVGNIQKMLEILPDKIAEMSKASSIVDKFRCVGPAGTRVGGDCSRCPT